MAKLPPRRTLDEILEKDIERRSAQIVTPASTSSKFVGPHQGEKGVYINDALLVDKPERTGVISKLPDKRPIDSEKLMDQEFANARRDIDQLSGVQGDIESIAKTKKLSLQDATSVIDTAHSRLTGNRLGETGPVDPVPRVELPPINPQDLEGPGTDGLKFVNPFRGTSATSADKAFAQRILDGSGPSGGISPKQIELAAFERNLNRERTGKVETQGRARRGRSDYAGISGRRRAKGSVGVQLSHKEIGDAASRLNRYLSRVENDPSSGTRFSFSKEEIDELSQFLELTDRGREVLRDIEVQKQQAFSAIDEGIKTASNSLEVEALIKENTTALTRAYGRERVMAHKNNDNQINQRIVAGDNALGANASAMAAFAADYAANGAGFGEEEYYHLTRTTGPDGKITKKSAADIKESIARHNESKIYTEINGGKDLGDFGPDATKSFVALLSPASQQYHNKYVARQDGDESVSLESVPEADRAAYEREVSSVMQAQRAEIERINEAISNMEAPPSDLFIDEVLRVPGTPKHFIAVRSLQNDFLAGVEGLATKSSSSYYYAQAIENIKQDGLKAIAPKELIKAYQDRLQSASQAEATIANDNKAKQLKVEEENIKRQAEIYNLGEAHRNSNKNGWSAEEDWNNHPFNKLAVSIESEYYEGNLVTVGGKQWLTGSRFTTKILNAIESESDPKKRELMQRLMLENSKGSIIGYDSDRLRQDFSHYFAEQDGVLITKTLHPNRQSALGPLGPTTAVRLLRNTFNNAPEGSLDRIIDDDNYHAISGGRIEWLKAKGIANEDGYSQGVTDFLIAISLETAQRDGEGNPKIGPDGNVVFAKSTYADVSDLKKHEHYKAGKQQLDGDEPQGGHADFAALVDILEEQVALDPDIRELWQSRNVESRELAFMLAVNKHEYETADLIRDLASKRMGNFATFMANSTGVPYSGVGDTIRDADRIIRKALLSSQDSGPQHLENMNEVENLREVLLTMQKTDELTRPLEGRLEAIGIDTHREGRETSIRSSTVDHSQHMSPESISRETARLLDKIRAIPVGIPSEEGEQPEYGWVQLTRSDDPAETAVD